MKKLLTFFIALIISNSVSAQIPNPGFEVWDSSAGYKVPIGWDNLNPVTIADSILTCYRYTGAYAGTYYIGLMTENVPGMGVVGGIAVSGKLDPVTHLPASGFPFTSRPVYLTGAWQYMPYHTSDSEHIAVFLSKWNSSLNKRDTVAYTDHQTTGMVMAWARFYIPLTYYSSATPDSAMIVLSSSGTSPVAYSFLWIDDLSFTDSVPLGVNEPIHMRDDFSVFPNPAKDLVHISFYSEAEENISVLLSDITGKTIKSLTLRSSRGNNEFRIETSGLAKGFYILKIADERSVTTKKLIID